MQVEFTSDFPITDVACKKATGKTLQAWYGELDALVAKGTNRRDAIQWIHGLANKDAWWSTTIWVEYERARKIVNKKDGRIEGYNICVTKTIADSPAQVFAAMSQPAALKKWFGDQVKASVKDQGTFEDAAGNRGEYLRIRPDKDLRFTWQNTHSAAPSQVDIALAAKGADKTAITLNHTRIQTRDEADGLRKAWGAAFDRLKSQLEGNAS